MYHSTPPLLKFHIHSVIEEEDNFFFTERPIIKPLYMYTREEYNVIKEY